MKRYLLPKEGRFFKTNLHCHTTFSDGHKTPQQIKELYMSKGYSAVAFTDHNVLIPHDELTDESFVALHGVEIDFTEEGPVWENAKTCHICMIGLEPENIVQPCWHRSRYVWGDAIKYRDQVKYDPEKPDFVREYTAESISTVMKAGREQGFFVTYNHPSWSCESYPDYIRYSGMHAIEMFNGASWNSGFEEYNSRVYDDFLRAGKYIYCIGTDDNHNGNPDESIYSDSGVAFTMIKAASLHYRSLTKALEAGFFYASEGPEIYELWLEDGIVHIRTSSSQRITLICSSRSSRARLRDEGTILSEAEFELSKDCSWFRLVVIDQMGRRACTNAYHFPL